MRSMCTHVQEIAAAELAVHALEARKHLAGVVPRSSSLVEGCVVVEGGQKANVAVIFFAAPARTSSL